jgi:hypothetical protein
MRRSAAFVFDLPGGGFAWVEPAYRDPFGPASPAAHMRPRASVVLLNEAFPNIGFSYADPETGEKGMLYPWRRDDLPGAPELEAFSDTLAAEGIDPRAERERVRPAISGAAAA